MDELVKRLEGRVAVVTGAGRGLGRAHARYLAAQGASVVVNDLGGDVHGRGADHTPAAAVVEAIRADGGEAVVSGHDISDWQQAEEMIRLAVETFGDLHVLVNNAGILRDKTLANMAESDWDDVLRVHLKGHAAPSRHAMAYWRERSKAGEPVAASVVHTTSIAAFAGNFGQANYTSAKAAVLGLSQVIALEGAKIGVRSNAVSPSARTRIMMTRPDSEPDDVAAWNPDDPLNPANVSPLVGWLAEESCPATGQVFHTYGNRVIVVSMPSIVHDLRTDGRWTPEALDVALSSCLVEPPALTDFLDIWDEA
jgi:NAD(P)-dependent dehydrogenase (short-subunit alcohol dehydrogenase family)